MSQVCRLGRYGYILLFHGCQSPLFSHFAIAPLALPSQHRVEVGLGFAGQNFCRNIIFMYNRLFSHCIWGMLKHGTDHLVHTSCTTPNTPSVCRGKKGGGGGVLKTPKLSKLFCPVMWPKYFNLLA